MGSTIGSRPPVSTVAPTARASTASAATAAPAAGSSDTFAAGGSSGPFGRKTISQTPDQIKAMSSDEVKKFEPAEIMGMTKNQFDAYTSKAPFDSLSKDQKRAVLRKTILQDLLQYLVDDMSKHDKLGADA